MCDLMGRLSSCILTSERSKGVRRSKKRDVSRYRQITPHRKIAIDRVSLVRHVEQTMIDVFELGWQDLEQRHELFYIRLIEMSILWMIHAQTGVKEIVGYPNIPTSDDLLIQWYELAMRYNGWYQTGHTTEEAIQDDLDRINEFMPDYLNRLNQRSLDLDDYFGSGYEIIEVCFERYAITIEIVGDYRVQKYHEREDRQTE